MDDLQLCYISAAHDVMVNNRQELGVIYCAHAKENIILQPISGNFSLLPVSFESCPEKVACDIIHMRNEVLGSLARVGVTLPIFTDGYSDLDPSCFRPIWSMLDHTKIFSKSIADSLNKAYYSFIYLPSQFSHLN